MPKTNREVWKKRVERWRDSGLSAKDFAKESGINALTLQYWSSRLNKEKRQKKNGEHTAKLPTQWSQVDTGFVQVVPVSRSLAANSIEPTAPFEIILNRGVQLLVPPDFETPAFLRLLSALEER